MAIRNFRPTTPSRRFMSVTTFDDLTSTRPLKRLTRGKKRTGGRNNVGRIAIRHRGGGHKRALRAVDFRRDKLEVPGKVATLEYDPNRSANIALVQYADGEKRYIIAPQGLNVGDSIASGADADIRVGHAMPLDRIPVGTTVHCIEMTPGKGAQLARSAGSSAVLQAKEGKF